MPLTAKGEKILKSMKKQYGTKKGKQVFYASQNKGIITGTHLSKKHKKTKVKRQYRGSGLADAAALRRGYIKIG